MQIFFLMTTKKLIDKKYIQNIRTSYSPKRARKQLFTLFNYDRFPNASEFRTVKFVTKSGIHEDNELWSMNIVSVVHGIERSLKIFRFY